MMSEIGGGMLGFAERHPRFVTWTMALSTVLLVAFAALPSVWPRAFPILNAVVVDTDPENMLSEDEPVRVFHNAMKREFSLHDIVVVGIANERHPDGVFNVESLRRIYELTEFARSLSWSDPGIPGRRIGVIEADMLAPSTVDNIEQAGLGTVSFNWLMSQPPRTRDEALAVRERARRLPLLDGTLVSKDGRAVALYLPLTHKNLSYRVREALLDKVASWPAGEDQVYITGLPVAEDTFGVEMFYQMAISAPLAMLVVFLAMWWFFRDLRLIFAPMIVAMVAVAGTMALLVISGRTIHIMSSMIPVFIMPIAVLDGVHILSEYFDRCHQGRDRRQVMREVFEALFIPMLFTSLTTMVGFASLALTPIPPVQVFGIFVAIGVFLAWAWTMLFVPAYVMLIPQQKLAGFGRVSDVGSERASPLVRLLPALGHAMFRHAKAALAIVALVIVVAGYGIGRIEINDNPVEWFVASHPIRIADRVLNEHFGGTYMAYLALEPAEHQQGEVFKRPEVLRYIGRLQEALLGTGGVGKSNSLTDLVKVVHRELLLGEERAFRVPDTAAAVAQTLLTFESSHRPHDLWHFVTPDFRKTSIWVQLRNGDNRDMSRVIAAVERFFAANPAPVELKAKWFGLNYVNVVWQEKMVNGMLKSLLGSFVVVLVLMIVLFRSLLWGLLSMIPLTVTIGLSYGIIGLIGKDYDMPIAVLSSLSLGLAVDYAIHFVARVRAAYPAAGSWRRTIDQVFGEPARAITRNALVLGVGFLPLVAAPLVPYQTVGVFIAVILLTAGASSLLILPALITTMEKRLFPPPRPAPAH